MAEPGNTTKMRRRAGLQRIAGLLDELRALPELREVRPGSFMHGSCALLHFHYPPDGQIVADVRLPDGSVRRFDVSDEGGRQEVLSVIEDRVWEAARS